MFCAVCPSTVLNLIYYSVLYHIVVHDQNSGAGGGAAGGEVVLDSVHGEGGTVGKCTGGGGVGTGVVWPVGVYFL